MAYENVDTYKLQLAFAKIGSVTCLGINTLKNTISENSWDCKSRERVKTALEKLSDEYELLNEKIKVLKDLPPKIKEYQKLETSNKQNESKRYNLRNEYNRTDPKKEWQRNSLQRQINSVASEINKNNNRMSILKNEINNLLEG